MSATDPVFAAAATRHWAAAATCAKRHGDNSAGIFNSPGGLAASLIIGAEYLPDTDAQREAVVRAARWLCARALDLGRLYQERRQEGDVTAPWTVYDAISGLAGIGRVLLAALTSGNGMTEPGVVAALKTLTKIIGTHGNRPGWWLPPCSHPPGMTVHPSGAATTGMAHGIAGPLATLSIAHIAGWSVAGLSEAIHDAAQWLLHWRENTRHPGRPA